MNGDLFDGMPTDEQREWLYRECLQKIQALTYLRDTLLWLLAERERDLVILRALVSSNGFDND